MIIAVAMRRRITLVHSKENEVTVQSILNSRVDLEIPVPGSLEEKITWDSCPIPGVAGIRIHANRPQPSAETSQLSAIFSYSYQVGLHVYVKPNIEDIGANLETFFQQVNEHLIGILGYEIEVGLWIQSLDTFYYHSAEIPDVRLPVDCAMSSSWTALDYYRSQNSTTLKIFNPQTALVTYDAMKTRDYSELGIFTIESQSTPDDLILSGVRILLNDDSDDNNQNETKNVYRTVFHVKPRHRCLKKAEANVQILLNGLRPILSIESVPETPVDQDIDQCDLFVYLTLQKSVFADRYQLPDGLKVLGQFGTKNLEFPEYSLDQWGTEFLLQWTDPFTSVMNLTLHTRYQLPNQTFDMVRTEVDNAILFYACDATIDPQLLSNSVFDNKRAIGGSFERFFTDDSVFYHLSERKYHEVAIPTLQGNPVWINLVTLLALICGMIVVLSAASRKVFKKKKKTE